MGREYAVYEKFREDYPVLRDQPVWAAFELLLQSCRKAVKRAGKSWSAEMEAVHRIRNIL